jgi:hypothetical protein
MMGAMPGPGPSTARVEALAPSPIPSPATRDQRTGPARPGSRLKPVLDAGAAGVQ